MKFSSFYLLSLCVLIFLAGCEKPNKNKNSAEWDLFVNRFIDNYFEYNPTDAVNAGKHEFDGQLPDLSKENIHKQINWLYQIQDSAQAFDTTSLNDRQKFDREYFLAVVDDQLFWLEDAQDFFRNPTAYSGIMDPGVYITRNYAALEARIKAYTKYANAVPKFLDQMKANLETPLPKTFALVGKNSFLGFADFYKNDVPQVFSSIKDKKLQDDFNEANKKAIAAATNTGNWFKDQLKKSNDSYALGEELYKKMLWKTERVNISLDELQKIGEKDLNRNLASLKEACEELAPGKSVEECVLMVLNNKPKNGPVAEAREQLKELKQFVIDKKIVAIPGTEEAQVEESPPYNRSNSAYIDIPGPYEKKLPSIYYISPPNPSWTKKEQEEYVPSIKSLLFTSVHEVWPGHFLQFLYVNRAPSKLEQLFSDYAFVEGWAHYTEEMMWDEGLGTNDPSTHIGQLFKALWRNVRFLSAIGLHTRNMSVEESEKMFKGKAFQDVGNAKQQAARGTYDPAYLNYTMGKLMILKLKKDWLKIHPNLSLEDFHNKFLSYGSPPIPLIRKVMLGKYDDGKLF